MLNCFYFLLCLLIFLSISLLETRQNKSSEIKIIKKILRNVYWNSFNEVEYVKYCNKYYYLIDMFGNSKLKVKNVDKRIRIATIFLDCATANFLYTILNFIEYFRNQCVNILKQDSSKVHACVLDLLNILPFVKRMLSIMNSAIDYLESFISLQWIENIKYNCNLKYVIDFIEAFYKSKDNLNISLCTHDNFSSNKLVALVNFHNNVKGILDFNAEKYCSLKLDNPYVEWNKWINKYNCGNPKTNSDLPKHLSKQIYEKIENFILEKYLKFGFQYDSETGKTYLSETRDKVENEENFQPVILESMEKVYNENYCPILNESMKEVENEENFQPVILESMERVENEENFQPVILESMEKVNNENYCPILNENMKEGSNTKSNAEDSEKCTLIRYPDHLRPFNRYLH
ncbi:uncharacterized protein LOC126901882 isoform X4 [Daktulosphaira vitifoliae]|uniref:uncharacterized protein LOC126901882 isoform X4 n=1 Tax=Daktulosphaira vitifoliae TaxID=58002 RepID=UPI0021A9A3A4|nr:uncharacterized protein LOC126901882 isoform X4 [Daktulosphaira vitifoliae]